jgi:glycosyltransferase involved in cell wall biosynthesis
MGANPSLLDPVLRMRILFLTQYYPPETGAAQNRLRDLAFRMARSNHEVTVLTAVPNYPQGAIFDGYKGRLLLRREESGVRVVRTWLYTTKQNSFLLRILNYVSFSVLSFFFGLLVVGSVDAVVVESPPLFLGLSGYFLAKCKRARFVLNISDLWPESAVVLGMLKSPNLARLATRVEEALYRRACLITGQTEGIIESIRRRCPNTPTELLTNGVAPEFLALVDSARKKREILRAQFGFGQKLVVAYTGVHGLAQGLETILSAAEILSRCEEILFVFFGDGPVKCYLEALSIAKELPNVRFLPPQEASTMPGILSAIDISIVPLRRHDLFKGALPSKLFEAIGAGVPVLCSIQGEAQALVERSGGGIAVEPENPAELAEAILRLHRDPSIRQCLGAQGRHYIATHYSRKRIAEKFDHLLIECALSRKTCRPNSSTPYIPQRSTLAASQPHVSKSEKVVGD